MQNKRAKKKLLEWGWGTWEEVLAEEEVENFF